MGACARNMQSDSAEINSAQCCIKLVFHLTYTVMHGNTKLKFSGKTYLIVSSSCGFSGLYLCSKVRDVAFLVLLQQRADYRVSCTFLEDCEIKDSFYLCRRRRLGFRSPDFLRPEYVIQRKHTPFALQTELRRKVLNVIWSSYIYIYIYIYIYSYCYFCQISN